MKKKNRTVPFILFVIVFSIGYGFAEVKTSVFKESPENIPDIIWLEFKLLPNLDADRKAIKESDEKRWEEAYKKYKEDRERNEEKFRKEYEKMYSNNPEFLKKNPYKFPDFKIPKIDYDIMGIVDIKGDGQNAFVVAEILKERKFSGEARIRRYQKELGGFWKFVETIQTSGDVGINKSSGASVTSGCQPSGIFVTPIGNGMAIVIWNESKKRSKADNQKITSIVPRELKEEIKRAKEEYRKDTNVEYKEELRIAGIFIDVNGDGKLDIIANINDPKYMHMYSDGKKMPTGSRFQLFCLGNRGCEHFLLLNKRDSSWEKIPLGYTKCIGISNPKYGGIREIYMERAAAIWDGSTYKIVSHKPNWMAKE